MNHELPLPGSSFNTTPKSNKHGLASPTAAAHELAGSRHSPALGQLSSPFGTYANHAPSSSITSQTVTSNLNTIASLMSPNPDSPSYDMGNFMEPIPSRKDLAPWAQDTISRPKSADVTLSSSAGTPGSPAFHGLTPPNMGQGIKRYTSTPPPPGINISGAATQPTPAAVVASASLSASAKSGSGANAGGFPSMLDFEPQYAYADLNQSWASMTNTPVNAMFSPIPTSAGGNSNSAAKINADMANATAMKLAALSTVNGRVALDSDVKKYQRNRKTVAPLDLNDDSNDGGPYLNSNNNSLPLPSLLSPNVAAWGMAVDGSHGSGSAGPPSPYRSPHKHISHKPSASKLNSNNSGNAIKKPSTPAPTSDNGVLDVALLEDIGAWLKSLRLHKYTDCLKDLPWQELVKLDDAALEARGVNALGARRKMLKAFEAVADAQAAGTLK